MQREIHFNTAMNIEEKIREKGKCERQERKRGKERKASKTKKLATTNRHLGPDL